MAGSYNHIVYEDGNLLDNDDFVGMIENPGDAYEMAKQMYGMIWFLAADISGSDAPNLPARVETARRNYKYGLEIAQSVQKVKMRP